MKKKVLLSLSIAVVLLLCVFVFINYCNKREVIIVDKYNNTELERGEFWGVERGTSVELKIGNIIDSETIVVDDEKLALEIANAVFKAYYGDEIMHNTEFRVLETEDRKYFSISRFDTSDNIMGSSPTIVIRKKDGAIVKIGGD